MSIRKDIWVCCDKCGECGFPSSTAKEARKEAKRVDGWIVFRGKDYCWNCKASVLLESKDDEAQS